MTVSYGYVHVGISIRPTVSFEDTNADMLIVFPFNGSPLLVRRVYPGRKTRSDGTGTVQGHPRAGLEDGGSWTAVRQRYTRKSLCLD